MKLAGWMALALLSADARAHEHLSKHNMVLVGEKEIFASHIVYKSPHNFQVILKVDLDGETKDKYLAARKGNPGRLMILLLDPIDISRIAKASDLSGTLYSEDPTGNRTEVEANVKLGKGSFQLLYFDEVPLSLAPAAELPVLHRASAFPGKSKCPDTSYQQQGQSALLDRVQSRRRETDPEIRDP